MNQGKPRFAGQLHIGSVIYRNGVFSVEMLFTANSFFPGEDEMKSAAQAAARHFLQLLHQNGFHSHGEPMTEVAPQSDRSLKFYIACKAARERPPIIELPMWQSREDAGNGKT